MLSHFIIWTMVLYVLFNFPQAVLGAAVIIGILYYLSNQSKKKKEEKSEESKEENTAASIKRIYKDAANEDGSINWEKHYKSKVDDSLKAGFKDDPEWKANSEQIKEELRKNRIAADREEQEAINEEINEEVKTFWQRVQS